MDCGAARGRPWGRLGMHTVVALAALFGLDGVLSQKWKTDLGPCYRDCNADPTPRLCHFKFDEEVYAVLTGACKNCSAGVEADCYSDECVFADGVERTVYTLNRQMPGPGIHVCRGDTIRVDLKVDLLGHGEAIHWHGLPQAKTPWFDGVAWVTQCPIPFATTFRYEFLAEPAGTYFYHSHSGLHKVNGIVGVLVIRDVAANNPHRGLYDFDLPEHTLILQDWMHVDAEFVMPGLASRLTGQPSDALLVNGQGRYRSTATGTFTQVPMATFEIQPGKKYRLRFINAGALSCPIQVQIEGHKMRVIATDGLDFKPHLADSLLTFSGERWDVVIEAQKKPTTKAFWIYLRTAGFCQNQGASEQRAVLVYKGASSKVPPTAAPGLLGRQLPSGRVVNSPGDCGTKSQVCASELHALGPHPFCTEGCPKANGVVVLRAKFVAETPNVRFGKNNFDKFLAFGPVTLTGVLNDIAYADPAAPFLSQPSQAPHCSEERLPQHCRNQSRAFCQCSHLIEVPYGEDVDMLVIDETDISSGDNSTTLLAHPMHLHGTSFAVMGMGLKRTILDGRARAKAVRALYDRKALPAGVPNPVLKDVLALPGGGWIWLRFRADNRGSWFFHCHFQYHMASGMEAVIQVGESRYLPRPPANFPKCGNFIPQ